MSPNAAPAVPKNLINQRPTVIRINSPTELALKAGTVGVDPLEHLAAAHRLRGDPDRLARGALEHRVGVAAERVEVGERERRLDPGEDRLVAVVELGVAHGERAYSMPTGARRGAALPAAGSTMAGPGEVAEWLKALAC